MRPGSVRCRRTGEPPGIGFEDAAQVGEELGRAACSRQAQVERQVRPARQIQEGHRLAIDGHALLTHVHLALDLDDDVLSQVGLNRLIGAREEEHIHRTRQILDRRNRPRVTLLRHLRRHPRHQAGDLHDAIRHRPFRAHDLRDLVVLVASQRRLHPTQRVIRDVQAQHLTLSRQLRLTIELGQVRECRSSGPSP